MMIAVHPSQRRERLSTVMRHVQREAEGVDGLVVLGIHSNLAEYPAIGARVGRHERIRLGYLAPTRSAIVASIDLGAVNPRFHDRPLVGIALPFSRRSARFVTIDERVEHAGIRSADVDSDPAAILSERQTSVGLGPGLAAVAGLPDAALLVTGLDARV